MLKIAGKELVLSQTFLMNEGEEVVLTLNEMPGIRFQFQTTGKTSAMPVGVPAFSGDMNEGTVTVKFPFTDTDSMGGEVNYLNFAGPDGKFGCRFSGHPAGSMMAVQFDLMLERTPDFGVR